MRTTSRLAVSAAVLGGGLLLATPAAAQEACPYPFTPSDARCQGTAGGGSTGGSTTVVDNSPVRTTAGSGGGAALPFTGGEVTLIALAGVAAVGGGAVLVASGRKRATV